MTIAPSVQPLAAAEETTAWREAVKSLLPSFLLRRRLPRRAGNSVLLTFDDGPTPGVTEEVLARLSPCGARAVFFLVGVKIAKAPDLVETIHRAGQAVGNHSFVHAADFRWPGGESRRDLQRCQDLIRARIGRSPRLFRFPTGKISLPGLLLPLHLGLRSVLWSLDSLDWRCETAEQARRIGQEVGHRATRGDIILLHDFSSLILPLLDELLPLLRSRGLALDRGLASLGRLYQD